MSEESKSTFSHNGALSEIGEVFKALPARFKAGQVDSPTSFHFLIDDEEWTVVIEPRRCSVGQGKTVDDPDCFLRTSIEILLGTIRGTYKPGLADLMNGNVKTNNPFLLQTFKDTFA